MVLLTPLRQLRKDTALLIRHSVLEAGSVFLSPALFPVLVDWGMWEALQQFPVLFPVAAGLVGAVVSSGVLAVANN